VDVDVSLASLRKLVLQQVTAKTEENYWKCHFMTTANIKTCNTSRSSGQIKDDDSDELPRMSQESDMAHFTALVWKFFR
jgi:hypothetical protein